MTRDLSKFTEKNFDLLVIGGGILGAGVAWDASLRGLSVALVEQGDFAGGSSSKTTKLIHGGIRYLESLEFKLVAQAIQERATLLRLAPGLVKPLPFLIPVIDESPRPWPLIKVGVVLYDFLAGKNAIKKHEFLKGAGISDTEPLLSQTLVRQAAVYQDAQMEDARLVLEVVKAAAQAGAQVANHCPLVRFLTEGPRIVGAVLEDALTGRHCEIRATLVVNATGPWVDRLRQLADPKAQKIVRPSKGVHVVCPNLGLGHALVLSTKKDGRIFFLIPWRNMTLIGTTDTDYSGDPGQAHADRDDVDYLLRETNRLLPRLRLDRDDVIMTFAGVRPLAAQEKKDPWAVSRMHLIHEDKNGLVSIVGGKFTTFRKIAQELVDWARRRFPGRTIPSCQTAGASLGPGAKAWRSDQVQDLFKGVLREGEISPSLAPHLVRRYGAGVKPILEWIRNDPQMAHPLCPHHPFIQAEVRFAVEEEMARTLSDLLWRRFGIGFSPCHGRDAAQNAVTGMGTLLGWDEAERGRQVLRYRNEIAANLRGAEGSLEGF